jgi:hypothetical protein
MVEMGSLKVSCHFFTTADDDPPLTTLDLNYGPLIHGAFRRMFKPGLLRKRFNPSGTRMFPLLLMAIESRAAGKEPGFLTVTT